MTGPFLLPKNEVCFDLVIPHYSFLANNQLSMTGMSRMMGAQERATGSIPLLPAWTNKVRMPIRTITTDQRIILCAPYLFILYQFSSDTNDFLKRMPYQRFIVILSLSKGMHKAIVRLPTKILERPNKIFVSIVTAHFIILYWGRDNFYPPHHLAAMLVRVYN